MTRGGQLNTISNPLQKHAEKMHQTPLQSAFSTIPRGGGTLQSTIQARSADADPCLDFRDCLVVPSSVHHSPVGAFRKCLRATLWEVRPSWFPVGSQGRVLHLASLPVQASPPYTFSVSFCDENRLSCHRRLGALGAGIGRSVRTSGPDQVLHSFKTDFKFSLRSLMGLTLPRMSIGYEQKRFEKSSKHNSVERLSLIHI